MRPNALTLNGVATLSTTKREEYDFYATDPRAIDLLLEQETFSRDIWECACGMGHLSEPLKAHGYTVLSTDIVDRGYGDGVCDFLSSEEIWDGDIITNPPFNKALEFVQKALNCVRDGHKVAMFLKIQFLESKNRKAFFEQYPPQTVYVFSSRLICARNADFEAYKSSAVCYCWFVWKKGFTGNTTLKWIN